MMGLYIALAPLLLVMVGLIVVVIRQETKDNYDYTRFIKHASRAIKGNYKVDRNKYYLYVITFGNTKVMFEPKEKSFEESKSNIIKIEAKYNTFEPFKLEYDLKKRKIIKFDCTSHFANKMKEKEFLNILSQYITIIAKNELGQKTERQKVKELIENRVLGEALMEEEVDAKNKVNESKNELTTNGIKLNEYPIELRFILETVNENVHALYKEKASFDIVEFHKIEQLTKKRIPHLLNYYNVFHNERKDDEKQEIKELLESVNAKLESFLDIVKKEEKNNFEKEKMLTEQLIK